MNVFVSVPMSGRTHDDIFRDQQEAVDYIRRLFPDDVVKLINPHSNNVAINNGNPIKWLGESIKMMADANLVVFTGEWWTHHGCVVERKITTEYRLPVCLLSNPEPQVRIEGPEVKHNGK